MDTSDSDSDIDLADVRVSSEEDDQMPLLHPADSDVEEDNVEQESESDSEDDLDGMPVLQPNLPHPPPANAPPIPHPVYTSPDGTQWTTHFPPPGQAQAQNVVHVAQAAIGPAAAAGLTEVQLFNNMITNAEIQLVVNYTNAYAAYKIPRLNQARMQRFQQQPGPNRPPPTPYIWKPVDQIEIRSFIGILLLAGVQRHRKFPIHRLWSTNMLWQNPACPAAMGRDRFFNIMAFMRFDDAAQRRQDRANGIAVPRLAPISQLFDLFIQHIQQNYQPGFYLTVDEMLVKFRGRCPFRVYMPKKPGRYGIKVWAAADANTRYVCNMQIYQGMVGNQREVNQGRRVTLDMVEPWFGSGRGITTDQGFTSRSLALALRQRQLSLVGTIVKRRREVPPQMRTIVGRQPLSSIFCRNQNITMVSYRPRNARKVVALISTEHQDAQVNLANPDRKPFIIEHYNLTKCGVDLADQLISEYSCHRSTRRWPMTIFFHILNVAAMNAFTLYTIKNPNWRPRDRARRSIFLEAVSHDLIWEQIYRRSGNENLKASTRDAMKATAAGLHRALAPINQQPAAPPAGSGHCRRVENGRVCRKTTIQHCQLPPPPLQAALPGVCQL